MLMLMLPLKKLYCTHNMLQCYGCESQIESRDLSQHLKIIHIYCSVEEEKNFDGLKKKNPCGKIKKIKTLFEPVEINKIEKIDCKLLKKIWTQTLNFKYFLISQKF